MGEKAKTETRQTGNGRRLGRSTNGTEVKLSAPGWPGGWAWARGEKKAALSSSAGRRGWTRELPSSPGAVATRECRIKGPASCRTRDLDVRRMVQSPFGIFPQRRAILADGIRPGIPARWSTAVGRPGRAPRECALSRPRRTQSRGEAVLALLLVAGPGGGVLEGETDARVGADRCELRAPRPRAKTEPDEREKKSVSARCRARPFVSQPKGAGAPCRGRGEGGVTVHECKLLDSRQTLGGAGT